MGVLSPHAEMCPEKLFQVHTPLPKDAGHLDSSPAKKTFSGEKRYLLNPTLENLENLNRFENS